MSGWQRIMGLALLASGLIAATAQADGYSPRQYYGPWQYSTSGNYHYRPYYYKTTPTYVGYKHHYVIYQPRRDRNHYYFYNPYKKAYWGRCPSSYAAPSGYTQEAYSLLPESTRRAQLQDIPESAFPPPSAAPVIPEATDRAQLDLPPDDAPPPASPPPGGAPSVAPALAGPGAPPVSP